MNVSTPTHVGAAIRDRRKQLRMTQEDLARRVGTTRRWVSTVEHGNPGAELGLILKALGALGLTVDLDDGSTERVAEVPAPPDIDAVVNRARGRRR